MKKIIGRFVSILPGLLLLTFSAFAQNEFAATLEVLSEGVEVNRVNTANFISIQFEAIVGVGDVVRTDGTGEARITFFADGTDVVLENDTEYRIVEFQGDDEDFQLTVEVIAGQTIHRLNRVLGTASSYDVETPGMTLAARGTEFAIRVEADGRSGMLVSEGTVDADAEGASIDVPSEFGIRSEVGSDLSDVVRASSFDELDSALDGCAVSVSTEDDVSINVRIGPSRGQTRVGFIAADAIDTFIGVSADGNWYRIEFDAGAGWILSTSATITGNCAGLRVFELSQVEDASLFANNSGTPAIVDADETAEVDEPVSDEDTSGD